MKPLDWLLQDGSAHRFLHIAQDNFYRNLTLEEQSNVGAFNFDHPTVSALKSCGSLSVVARSWQSEICAGGSNVAYNLWVSHACACMGCTCGKAATPSMALIKLPHECCSGALAGFCVG